jgi:hypothetical protein
LNGRQRVFVGGGSQGGNLRDGRIEHGPAMMTVAAHAARGLTGGAVAPLVTLDSMNADRACLDADDGRVIA